MDLLEPGGRKLVELGSASPPAEEEEEVEVVWAVGGADVAITPKTLSQNFHLKKKERKACSPSYFLLFLFYCSKISLQATEEGGKGAFRHTYKKKLNLDTQTCRRQGHSLSYKSRFTRCMKSEWQNPWNWTIFPLLWHHFSFLFSWLLRDDEDEYYLKTYIVAFLSKSFKNIKTFKKNAKDDSNECLQKRRFY